MTQSISVSLPESIDRQLRERAVAEGVSVEQLAKQIIEDAVTGSDETFEDLARRIVEQNKELYRRLA